MSIAPGSSFSCLEIGQRVYPVIFKLVWLRELAAECWCCKGFIMRCFGSRIVDEMKNMVLWMVFRPWLMPIFWAHITLVLLLLHCRSVTAIPVYPSASFANTRTNWSNSWKQGCLNETVECRNLYWKYGCIFIILFFWGRGSHWNRDSH